MSKREITAGATDQTITVKATSAITGAPYTGLAWNTSGLVCWYRKGATGALTQLNLATQTVTGAHSDGGFVELDNTKAPGGYRLDLTDAMVNTAGELTIWLSGVTNVLIPPVEIEVV